MRARISLTALLGMLSLATPTVGQQSPRLSTQAGLALARRVAPTAGASSTDGVQLLTRATRFLTRHVGLVAEGSVTRFPDETVIFAALCPRGQVCLDRRRQVPGLAMAGLAAGLQPRLGMGPLQLGVTATLGGYWLFHRASGVAGVAPGARASLGLGVPIGTRTRVVLEAGALHLLAPGTHDARVRHLGIGVAFN
jgi:hypothetical protein